MKVSRKDLWNQFQLAEINVSVGASRTHRERQVQEKNAKLMQRLAAYILLSLNSTNREQLTKLIEDGDAQVDVEI